jgi:hypothetical protein
LPKELLNLPTTVRAIFSEPEFCSKYFVVAGSRAGAYAGGHAGCRGVRVAGYFRNHAAQGQGCNDGTCSSIAAAQPKLLFSSQSSRVQRNQQTFQVESVMKEAAVAVPMQTSELLLVQDVGLEQLAKASASMENNLRVRIVALPLECVVCQRPLHASDC